MLTFIGYGDQMVPVLGLIPEAFQFLIIQQADIPEGARTIVKNLGGKGFLFVVSGGPEFVDPEVAEGFLNALAQEDVSNC